MRRARPCRLGDSARGHLARSSRRAFVTSLASGASPPWGSWRRRRSAIDAAVHGQWRRGRRGRGWAVLTSQYAVTARITIFMTTTSTSGRGDNQPYLCGACHKEGMLRISTTSSIHSLFPGEEEIFLPRHRGILCAEGGFSDNVRHVSHADPSVSATTTTAGLRVACVNCQ